MYNQVVYNQTLAYNQHASLVSGGGSTATSDLSYGGYPLNSDIIKFSATNYDNGHILDRTTYNNPIDNGIGEIAYYFRDKVINLTGIIKTESKTKLLEEMDRLKGILFKPGQDFILKYGESYRKGRASLTNPESLTSREHFHINFLPLNLTFSVLEFMEDIVQQNKSYTSRTTPINDEILNKGTATAKIVYTIIFNSATSVTSITIGNSEDKTIRINYNFTAGDSLIIDGKELTVKVNGAEVDYTGQIPKLPVGTSTLNVSPNGTYDISLNLSYFNTYQ